MPLPARDFEAGASSHVGRHPSTFLGYPFPTRRSIPAVLSPAVTQRTHHAACVPNVAGGGEGGAVAAGVLPVAHDRRNTPGYTGLFSTHRHLNCRRGTVADGAVF
jgi:hypothetical protein